MQSCQGCHPALGTRSGVGPRLSGRGLSATRIRDQIAHGIAKRGVARKVGIAFGILRRDKAALGLFHGAHDRGYALGILVNTDAKVDFLLSWVVAEQLDQLKDFVGRLRGQIGQHREVLTWEGAKGRGRGQGFGSSPHGAPA